MAILTSDEKLYFPNPIKQKITATHYMIGIATSCILLFDVSLHIHIAYKIDGIYSYVTKVLIIYIKSFGFNDLVKSSQSFYIPYPLYGYEWKNTLSLNAFESYSYSVKWSK